MKESIAILCGGGPAPGINSVISSVAIVFLKAGYRVIGIHEGYKGLFADIPSYRNLISDLLMTSIKEADPLCK